MCKVSKRSGKMNDKPTVQSSKHKSFSQSRTIQMKGENETEPSFVHSVKSMNKGEVKDEWKKQFSDV